MMNILQMLADAKTEIEFFAVVCKLTAQIITGVWGEIGTVSHPQHGSGLSASLTQSLLDELPNGQKRRYSKMTHAFTIYGDNTLVWKITDGQTLTGLAEIQAGLQNLSSVHNSTILPTERTKPPLRIPLYRSLGYESQDDYEKALERSKEAQAEYDRDDE